MPDYTLPCQIGQRAFMIENHNKYRHYPHKGYMTKYGTKIVIIPFKVEAFIIDEEGVSIAEYSWDGWNKLSIYHSLSLENTQSAKVFFTMEEASAFVEGIRDKNQSFDLGGGNI